MEIKLQDISKQYDRVVLDRISHTFRSGKLYVVKGISGCGKSTLLNILGGIDKSFSGSISTDAPRSNVGYIFQNSLLISGLSIRENLSLLSDDAALTASLCEELGISALLDKYPNQLSGGERQRVAVVRALLVHPSLILADEPTASLDEENSSIIASLINDLCTPDRVVIVATHENCFDKYADEIIYLNYGNIERVDVFDAHRHFTKGNEKRYKPPKLRAFRYAMKRNPRLCSFGKLCPLILAFMLVWLMSAVQVNFRSECIHFLQEKYPMDLIIFSRYELDAFPDPGNLVIYENYACSSDDVNAYYLLNEEDSVLAIDGMIFKGTFPKEQDEILVTQEFIEFYFEPDEDFSNYLGRTIQFVGDTYVVSGILADITEPWAERTLFVDAYYQRAVKGNAIFIPYNTIKDIGEIQNASSVVAVYRNLPESERILSWIENNMVNGVANQFYRDIESMQYTVDNIISVFGVVLVSCFATSCIFLVTVVYADLFSRKREIGYLQIFGIRRQRVYRMLISEYAIKVLVAFAAATILYFCIIMAYYLFCGRLLTTNAQSIIGIVCLSSSYILSASAAILYFLRQKIIALIT